MVINIIKSMKNKYLNIFSRVACGTILVSGVSACSDVIDDHYGVSNGIATKTLWEQITAQPDLQNFAKVLEQVHYYTSEDEPSNLTFKDVLQANNKLTVWAPKDGSYNLDSLLACDEYDVEKRFIRNHINTFSKGISGVEPDTITMLNSKVNVLNNENRQFKGVDILESNIPATNGLLHKLAHGVEFQNNLYEFIQTRSDLDSLFTFFHDRDTTFIDEYSSVPGGIQNGEMTYADTVWTTRSKAFDSWYTYQGEDWDGLNANLKDEDSTFVMIMPTNIGWQKALEKAKKYYEYMSLPYENQDEDKKTETVNPKKLQDKQAKMAVVNRLVFSPNQQRGYKLEDFGNTDSLFTTRGTVIDTPYCNDIFRGIERIPVSNGYAYLANDYRYNVGEDIEVEAETSFYWSTKRQGSNAWYSGVVNSSNRNKKVKGSVSGGGYAYLYGDENAKKGGFFEMRIPEVLSGTYDIKVVVLPENIADTFKTTVLPMKFESTIYYYNGESTTLKSKTSEEFTSSVTDTTWSVDTFTVFENFKFPVAYKGVTGAYPYIRFDVTSKKSDWGKNFSKDLYIDKIILEAKDED